MPDGRRLEGVTGSCAGSAILNATPLVLFSNRCPRFASCCFASIASYCVRVNAAALTRSAKEVSSPGDESMRRSYNLMSDSRELRSCW
jgi:hypothetical protein